MPITQPRMLHDVKYSSTKSYSGNGPRYGAPRTRNYKTNSHNPFEWRLLDGNGTSIFLCRPSVTRIYIGIAPSTARKLHEPEKRRDGNDCSLTRSPVRAVTRKSKRWRLVR
jgi:hypothetical protein